jgi:hypothetical protein
MKAKLKLPTVNLIFEALIKISKVNQLTFNLRFKFKKLMNVFQDDAIEYAQQHLELIKVHTDWEIHEDGVTTFNPIKNKEGEVNEEQWGAYISGKKELDQIEDEYEFEPLTLDLISDLKSDDIDFNVLVDNRIVIE